MGHRLARVGVAKVIPVTDIDTRAVRKGQVWDWRGVRCEILRVARDQSWADLRVCSGMETWTKRQPLPFPADFWQQHRGEP